MNELLQEVKTKLMAEKYKKILSLPTFYVDIAAGWDIAELTGTSTSTIWHSCRGIGCEQTVVYDGKCVKASALNYALWGLVAAVMDYHFMETPIAFEFVNKMMAKGYTYYLKRWPGAHDETEPIALASYNKSSFVSSGYDFFTTNKLTIQEWAVYENCQIIPNNEYKGELNAHLSILDGNFSTKNDN